jgi:hypothetical protein
MKKKAKEKATKKSKNTNRILDELKNGSHKHTVGIQKTPNSAFSTWLIQIRELEGGSKAEYSIGVGGDRE